MQFLTKSNCCKGGLSSLQCSDLAVESCWPTELVSYTEAPLSELALGPGPSLWPQSGLGLGLLVPSAAKPPPHPLGASLHLWSAPLYCAAPSPGSSCPTKRRHDLRGTLPWLWAEANPKHNLPPPVTFFFSLHLKAPCSYFLFRSICCCSWHCSSQASSPQSSDTGRPFICAHANNRTNDFMLCCMLS